MKVTQIIENANKPLFTFELLPPLKGHNIESIFKSTKKLMEYSPSYINITNHQNEIVYEEDDNNVIHRKVVRKRPGTIGIAAALQYSFNIPAIPHLICGGMSDLEIENTLVELNFLSIDNVFALRGDPPHGERRFIPCENGYSHSSQMVEQIANMNMGIYLDENLKNPVCTDFCIGVAGYPEKHFESPNLDVDIINLKKKQDAGASYIVTQLFYDNKVYFDFVEKCRDNGITIPIIPGIKPISRKGHLSLIPTTFSIDIPSQLYENITKAKTKEEVKEVGIWWGIKQTKELLAKGVVGVHYYTVGSVDSVCSIVKECY
ncbi:MAG: methylenetetrahydrofolate reductase [Sphaerochaetaceae bacterium]|jgi:methylenetetrahydrofolate reductase (NADPH)|nr:methylenetetrahydrofolate reductase [Sphaerochaetaceae bacterium]